MKLRLIAIITLLAFLSPARADIVTWQLQNVGFDDGGQATGWFSVDNVTHTFLVWNISVNGGNTSVFPNALYDPQTSTLNGGDLNYVQPLRLQFYVNFSMIDASLQGRSRQLRLAFSDLPDGGGVVDIDPANPFAGECYNCGPVRFFANGGTIASVPEPSTWAMLLIGFVAIGFASRISPRALRRAALTPD